MINALHNRLIHAFYGARAPITLLSEKEGGDMTSITTPTFNHLSIPGEGAFNVVIFSFNPEWTEDLDLVEDGVEAFEGQLCVNLKEANFTAIASFITCTSYPGELEDDDGFDDPSFSLKTIMIDNEDEHSPLYVIEKEALRRTWATSLDELTVQSVHFPSGMRNELLSKVAADELVKAVNSDRMSAYTDVLNRVEKFNLDHGRIAELSAGRLPSSMTSLLLSMVTTPPNKSLALDKKIVNIAWSVLPQDQAIIKITAHLDDGKKVEHVINSNEMSDLISDEHDVKLPATELTLMILKTLHHKGEYSGIVDNSLNVNTRQPKVSQQ